MLQAIDKDAWQAGTGDSFLGSFILFYLLLL